MVTSHGFGDFPAVSGGISVTHIEDSRRMQRLEPSDPT